jgi:hypothetical protein
VPLTFSSGGVYALTARYPGDGATSPATSNSLTFTVAAYTGPPSFTFTQVSANEVNLGTSTTTPDVVPVTVSSVNGFSTPVILSFASRNNPDTPLTKDNSHVFVVAVDHTTGKPITSVTPLKTGAHVDLLFEYSDGTYARNENPFQNRIICLGAGLGFLGLLGIRKRGRKIWMTLLGVCLLAGVASTLAGCGATSTTIVVTATPTDSSTPAQKMEITASFLPNL